MKDLVRVIEALLFAADAPLRIEQILECVPEAREEEVVTALEQLRALYDEGPRGIGLFQVAGGHQILTRPEVGPWVEKFLVGRRRQRLSRAALEVLSIVAYRQPLTRGEIESVRGVDCGGVLRTLLERHLIMVRGRAKRVGNPLLYATSPRFLEHFGIHDLSELPKLEEFRALVDDDEARAELRDQGLIPDGKETAEGPLPAAGEQPLGQSDATPADSRGDPRTDRAPASPEPQPGAEEAAEVGTEA